MYELTVVIYGAPTRVVRAMTVAPVQVLYPTFSSLRRRGQGQWDAIEPSGAGGRIAGRVTGHRIEGESDLWGPQHIRPGDRTWTGRDGWVEVTRINRTTITATWHHLDRTGTRRYPYRDIRMVDGPALSRPHPPTRRETPIPEPATPVVQGARGRFVAEGGGFVTVPVADLQPGQFHASCPKHRHITSDRAEYLAHRREAHGQSVTGVSASAIPGKRAPRRNTRSTTLRAVKVWEPVGAAPGAWVEFTAREEPTSAVAVTSTGQVWALAPEPRRVWVVPSNPALRPRGGAYKVRVGDCRVLGTDPEHEPPPGDNTADPPAPDPPAAEPATVTIAGLGLDEAITLAAPADWHGRIRMLAAHTRFGPDYVRAVVDELRSMSAATRQGYPRAGRCGPQKGRERRSGTSRRARGDSPPRAPARRRTREGRRPGRVRDPRRRDNPRP